MSLASRPKQAIGQGIEIIKERAALLARVRQFFSERNFIEVDCPAFSLASSIDLHIEPMQIALSEGGSAYLHTSPEYGMKKLLSFGMQDIYQLSHVFREGETGALHRPEFMMAEWYRIGMPFDEFILETLSFIRLFIDTLATTHFTYREALLKYAGLDYVTASTSSLLSYLKESEGTLPSGSEAWDKDTLLNYITSFFVEPHLGIGNLCVITDFPASQAALSQTALKQGHLVAERFEVYCEGIELANGYHELTDPVEQKKRLEEANLKRAEAGKKTLPIDKEFLYALERGLPDSCGVAAGFDRLFMLHVGAKTLSEVLPLECFNKEDNQ